MLTESSSVPEWFERALAARPQHRDVRVAGRRIHYRSWGEPHLPGVVLVHGAGANSSWWDHIAPQLTGYHLVAPDLSGHGDSEHLASYDVRGWAEEILAAAGAEDLQQPVVIGHSLGGRVAINAGVDHANCISGVAFIDSPLSYQQPDEDPPYRWDRPHRVYAEADEAIERFRTLPPQETLLPYVRRHIARESLKRIDRGWTWKFDPLVFDRRPPLQEELARLAGPVALLRCEHGLVDVAMAAEMQRLATRPFPVIDLPAAGHHPMLDQPLIVVTALTTLLHVWPPR